MQSTGSTGTHGTQVPTYKGLPLYSQYQGSCIEQTQQVHSYPSSLLLIAPTGTLSGSPHTFRTQVPTSSVHHHTISTQVPTLSVYGHTLTTQVPTLNGLPHTLTTQVPTLNGLPHTLTTQVPTLCIFKWYFYDALR